MSAGSNRRSVGEMLLVGSPRRSWWPFAALFLLVPLLFGTACSQQDAQDAAAEFEIIKTYERAPVRVELKVERSKITVADRLQVVLEATAPESQQVDLPERSESLGEFAVSDFRTAQPRLVGEGLVLHRCSFFLEPFLAGEYEVPSLAVRFADKESSSAEPDQIATEAIPIEVASVLPQGEEQPELKEISEPVEMPAPWWPWAVAAAVLAALAAGLFWWRRRKRLEEEAIPIPAPHEVAYAELEKLLASGLLERGEAKLFYLRLSNVLRHYIEDRFGLRAPEQTTEEFLAALRQGQPFAPKHNESLQAFMEHCDLVKFAELQPTREEAETSVSLCRRFIDETKQEELQALETVGAK